MRYQIPKEARMCPSAAQCDSETQQICSAVSAVRIRSAEQSNAFAGDQLRSFEAESEALRQQASELKAKINDPYISGLIDNIRSHSEAHRSDLMSASEYVVVCDGPKKRKFLGPVCTAQVVKVAKRQ